MLISVNLKYFGKLTEHTRNSAEVVHVEENTSIEVLENMLVNKYYEIQFEDYILFLNNTKISKKDITLKQNDELCFMPLFTGG